jgi:DNA-binding beta-propeller fold protein YncE
MRTAVRLRTISLTLCLVGVLVSPGIAFGDGVASVGSRPTEGTDASSSLGGSLVTPGSPIESEQTRLGEVAKLSTPEAVAAREESQTKYEGLTPGEAAKVAGEAFPGLISEPAGGPPQLPTGQKITGFADANVAQTELGGGQSGVIESSIPMAIGSSGGGWTPMNLGLSEAGGAFIPAAPLVEVGIPKRLENSVRFMSTGVSAEPVDSSGTALHGSEGVLDGATVLYANTQTDTDTVVKPTTFGFAIDTVLRSVNSPQELAYKVGLPQGASLVQKQVSGPVQVVKEGVTIATVPMPSASDAAGAGVPVEMSVSADMLKLNVDHLAGSHQYPIEVDPEFDEVAENLSPANWHPSNTGGSTFATSGTELAISHVGSFPQNNASYFHMQTKGFSEIYAFSVADTLFPVIHLESGEATEAYQSAWAEIGEAGVEQHYVFLQGAPYLKSATVCANSGCTASGGSYENQAVVALSTTESSAEAESHGEHQLSVYGIELRSATTWISERGGSHASVSYNTSAATLDSTVNVFHNSGAWMGPNSGAFEFTANDRGIGVAKAEVLGKEESWRTLNTRNYLTESACIGVQCLENESQVLAYPSVSSLTNGEHLIRVQADDAVPNTWSSEYGEGEATLKIDKTPPHGVSLTGMPIKGETLELGENEAHPKAEATDGEGSTPSSGIKSLELYVDGREVGNATGACPRGPCTASAEWTISGADLGAGQHTLTVKATDNAGNIETKNYGLVVHHASPVALGPGSVNPESGDFAVGTADVDLSGSSGSLEVSRHYDSRDLKAGEEESLGPQWSLSLGSLAKLEVLPDGSVMVIGPEGLTHFTVKKGGGFEAPVGDSTLTLAAVQNEKKEVIEYQLKNLAKDTATSFTLPSGAKLWMATISKGPVATDTITDEYKTVEGLEGKKIVEPVLELAPHPSAECTPVQLEKLEIAARACHALKFEYDEETTASGEAKTGWGKYKNRLKEVIAIAYNPSTKTMAKISVAGYEYDKQGRLRAEWDPRISPTLETTYGYDAEGHLTALTSSGQESWAFIYGTLADDPSTGRLLGITRPTASTGLWNGEITENTAKPSLSGSTVPGVKMSVTNGTWSGSPFAYSYQWEDCNSSGGICSPIMGATNPTYTPTKSDIYHSLVVEVSATNGDGTVTALTAASSMVGTPVYSSAFGSSGTEAGKFSHPGGIVVDAKGNLWVLDHGNSRVEEFNEKNEFLQEFGNKAKKFGESVLKGPDGIAVDSKSDAWVANTGTNNIIEYNEHGEELRHYVEGKGAFKTPEGIATDMHERQWLSDTGNSRIEIAKVAGEVKTVTSSHLVEPEGIAIDSHGNAWVADRQGGIDEFNESGEYLKTFTGSGENKLEHPYGIAIDSIGNILVIDTTHNRVEMFNENGEYESQFGSTGSGTGQFSFSYPMSLTTNSSGDIWVTDSNNNRIEKWIPPTTGTEGATPPSPAPRWTVEYQVPLSGTGLPTMTKSEVEKWNQKDDPEYAAAIFPPDQPQSWPATNYKRATVYYLDSQARTVNVATPSGGVSTSEYNATNNVIRTLSPDDRASALKEAKPPEAAELLDTESKYNGETKEEQETEEKENRVEPGSRLLETRGPQHTVKLSSGAEVKARNHVRYFYDEDAPSGETYDLVTKKLDGAEYESKEADVRQTRTSYSGQKGLGWKLREPTSATTDPAGLDLTTTTVYEENAKEESTGNVVEKKLPAGSSETVYPPSFSADFGSAGSGNGQLKGSYGIALDSSGNVWAADTDNSRVEEFSAAGKFVAVYGKEGTGNVQFKEPRGVAVNQSTGNVYVADSGNGRVEELSAKGEFVRNIGTSGAGKLVYPRYVTIDASGDLWASDYAEDRVVEFSSEGTYIQEFGAAGSGNGQFTHPAGIAISEGSVYVVDEGNSRVEQFSTSGVYMGQFGSKGSGNGQFNEPLGIAANQSTGVLYVSDPGNDRMEEVSPAGKFLTEWETWGSTHEQYSPASVAVGATGSLYLDDPNANKIGIWLPPEAGGAHLSYSTQVGSTGSGNGQFSEPNDAAIDGKGNVWVTDYGNNRIEELTAQGKFLAAYGKYGSGEVQFDGPTGIAINESTGDVYVAERWNNRIQELSSTGTYIASFGTSGSGKLNESQGVAIDTAGNVWVTDTGDSRVVEFSSTGTYIAAYGKEGSGEDQFKRPIGLAVSGENVYVDDLYNHRIEEITTKGVYVRAWGFEGNGSGEFWSPEGITADAAGNLYVADYNADHIEEFSLAGAFKATFSAPGSGEGQLTHPVGDAIDPAGDLYIVDAGDNRIEKWDNNNQAAHDTKTIYYTAKSEAEIAACREHPEWVGLPCETEPVAQPGTSGLPELPVTQIEYNIWDQPETVTEKFGATERERKTKYDGAGRPHTSEVTSSVDEPLSKVTDEYNIANGMLETQSIAVKGEAKTITSLSNTLGEITSYTDAAGATTTYEYEKEKDARLIKMSYGVGTETFSQSYGYDETTGAMKELVDAATGKDPAVGKFTATYDVAGKMLSQSFPNGMIASYIRNSVGETTGLEYVKNAHCAKTCPEVWFSDTTVPSIHGEALSQTSTLAREKYAYDSAGRLDETQETPAGKGCATRLYTYDEESNRTSLTQRESATETCAAEGGSIERHAYDAANRLTDPGVTYETFGNTTVLPTPDAGEHELTSSYYVDNQVASQTQNGKTINYTYDPAGRALEAASTGTTKVSHYTGPGEALTWTSEGSEKWTRNIPGIDGTLDAIQSNAGTPVLQLSDLKGNIVATASLSETATELLTKYNSTEFGVPSTKEAPPKYAWLGAGGITSELSSGTVTQDGSTYVPQTGRPLQTQGVAPPVPTNASGTFVSPEPGSIAGNVAATSALATYNEEQARKAQVAAACNEEIEGCGPDPAHGPNPWGCRVWASWGHGLSLSNYIAVYAHWSCVIAPAHIEVQVALLAVINGKYVQFGTAGGESWYYPENSESYHKGYTCTPGQVYQAWVWGRSWDGFTTNTNWYATAEDGHYETCSAEIIDPTPGAPDGK